MNHEVLVVGGGIGGLTVAALLAARGVDVCLFERQSRVGGCVVNLEHFGYEFEPTFGLYAGWEQEGIHQRIFSALQASTPKIERLSPAYTVRLPDGVEIVIHDDENELENGLFLAFPECADRAIGFYRRLGDFGQGLENCLACEALQDCSFRFRSFIDSQLQTFTQSDCERLSLKEAAAALLLPRRGLWEIIGGAQAIADALADALKNHGGRLRLNSPVLRLAYGSDGQPIGVDLLSGERVRATRGIISNLTMWDTYGKLIGSSRVPREISSQLKQTSALGAHQLLLGMDADTMVRLPSKRLLVLTNSLEEPASTGETQISFSISPTRAPENKRPVTVTTFTDADKWFAFHEDESFHEEKDREMMESVWARLHSTMPELGDSVEVIDTATPLQLYENTRRRLGMIGRPFSITPKTSLYQSPRTIFPNVWMIGDTVSPGYGLSGVSEAAWELATEIMS